MTNQKLLLYPSPAITESIPSLQRFNDILQSESLDLVNESKTVLDTIPEKIRVSVVRSRYRIGQLTDLQVIEIWKKWKNQDEYLLLQSDSDLSKILAVKCSKRGNDVYRYRVEQRFKDIDSLSKEFDFNMFESNDIIKKSRAVFLTLTNDTKEKTKVESWQKIGNEWNRYCSNLKRKFGKFNFIRCFESFANGYCHLHAIILFDTKEFEVFEHFASNDILKGSSYRIQQKDKFEHWHSSIDISAVRNMGKAVNYVTKYLRKTNNEDSAKYEITQSQLWIHNKQSFAISTDFRKKLAEYRLVFIIYLIP